MKFHSTQLSGVWRIELEPREDERGFLARTYCEVEFAALGLNTRWPQCNLTRTLKRGTIRGLHWQAEPRPEVKLIRCVRGAVWDVVVDVRPASPTLGKWEAFELTGDGRTQLYLPAGVAHGFQTLEDDSELHYQMGDSYVPELARGLRWDDPRVGIPWPLPVAALSPRDRELPEWGRAQVVI
jgi:dTDP-4-dehydrorhamnose 3,5-epimerase